MADLWSSSDLIDTGGNVPATMYFVKVVGDEPVYVSGSDLTPTNIKAAVAWYASQGKPLGTFVQRLDAVYEWLKANKPTPEPEEEELDLDKLF